MFLPRTLTGTTVDSLVVLEPDALHAAAMISALNTSAQTDSGRQTLSKLLADGMRAAFSSPAFRARFAITGTPSISTPVLGQVSQPSPGTTIVPSTLSISGHTLHVVYAYVQLDRAIQVIELFNPKRAPSSSALAGYIAKARAHMRKGFTVANTARPTIGGTPAQGQTLTIDTGAWTGGAASFGYVWLRCAVNGSACAPIDGATGPTYVVSSADAASTIRVTVTGANTVSQAQATSTQTVVVS